MPTPSFAESGKSLFRRLLVVVALTSFGAASSALAATVTANFTSAGTVPVKVSNYTATGNKVKITLGYAPATGTTLTLVKNTGTAFISGQFSNLPQGRLLKLTYGGLTYRFVADYFGGTGNDLVLQWARREAWAWGSNEQGELGTTEVSGSGSLIPVPVGPAGVLREKTVLRVEAGTHHSLALCSDGTVAAWGRNDSGALGDGSWDNRFLPVAVNTTGALAGKRVVALAAGALHSLALCSDGMVVSWGANDVGQLGTGGGGYSNVPVAVSVTGALAGKTVVAIAAGYSHSLALCSDGKVVAWGNNFYGELGNGKASNAMVPSTVKYSGALSGKTVVGIAAGHSHSTALCSDGLIAAWGNNAHGQLGYGTISERVTLPVAVKIATGGLAGKKPVRIGSGSAHSFAICSDGTLFAWGNNAEGQLGAGSPALNSPVPIKVITSGALSGKSVASIRGGANHSLAFCTNGTAVAWGANSSGMLGTGTTDISGTPVTVVRSAALTGAKFMSGTGGEVHSVAVVATPLSGDSKLSGLSLSTGTLDFAPTPEVTQYAAGVSEKSGVALTVRPVSRNSAARITVNGQTVNSGAASAVIAPGTPVVTIVITSENGLSSTTYQVAVRWCKDLAVAFHSASGVGLTCPAFAATGLTLSASMDFVPAVGTGLKVIDNTGLNPISGEFSGMAQGQAIPVGGRLWVVNYHGGDGNDLVLEWHLRKLVSWGRNNYGQLGNGAGIPGPSSPPPYAARPASMVDNGILAGKTVLSISSGLDHSLALCSDGTIAAWGYNASGQLGNGQIVNQSQPVAVDRSGVLAGKKVVAISAGGSHGLALCSDGTLAAWGSNSSGQLGDGSTTNRKSPVAVDFSGLPAGRKIIAISAGSSHSLALLADGSVLGWGSNQDQRLGLGDYANRPLPVEIGGLGALAGKRVVKISAGVSHNLALCSDGSLVTWGTDGDGQLGDGPSTGPKPPISIASSGVLAGKSVSAIAAGGTHSLALCTDGTLAAWGSGVWGQLGNSLTNFSNVPVAVDGSGVLAGKSIVGISARILCSSAVLSDGTIARWGANGFGQLGDGTTMSRSTPVITDRSGILAERIMMSAAPGSAHVIALAAVAPSTGLSVLTANVGGMATPLALNGTSDYFIGNNAAGTSVTLTPTPVDFSATVQINGVNVPPGTASAPIPIVPGSVILVKVTAEDSTSTTYSVHAGSDITINFSSAAHSGPQYFSFDPTGRSLNVSLAFAPTVGTNLQVIDVVGATFITGRFENLTHGQAINLPFGSKTYHYVANYYGGTGNDLVLEWAHRSIAGWGSNNGGHAGIAKILAPVAMANMGVLTGKTVTAIAATANSSLALCADGTLATWAASQTSIPVAVKTTGALAGKTVAGIAAAAGHNLAVCSDGTVVAWGSGGYGQLGDGGNGYSSDPVPVSLGGKSVVSVAVGGYHSLAVCSDGSVLAWGGNDRGQLGDGTTIDRNVPVVISNTGGLAGKTVVAVSAGLQYSLALCSDGTLVAWGDHSSGQLGATFSNIYSALPRLVDQTGVLAGETVVALSQASHSTPTVLCSSGKVVTWGLNNPGQRGSYFEGSNYQPGYVDTTGPLAGKAVSSISSGGSSSIAICSDGAVTTWGSNVYGQLGNANFGGSYLPVSVTDNGVLTGGKPLFAALAYHAVVVVAESDEGYRGWTFEQSTLAQKGASADPDGDGIPNALEYVLRGDPTVASTGILPTVSADGGNFVFDFTRLAASAESTTQVFQYSADMVNWIDLPIFPSAQTVVGTVDANGNQEVTVTVPKGANTQLFGRLKVALK